MSDMEMTTLPPQYSMSESSPMSQSGYELVSLMGADNTSAQWQVVGDEDAYSYKDIHTKTEDS